MFKQEMFGYSKEDVEQYLVETLERLESFEHTIEVQKQEIKSLERQIEMLKTGDSSEVIIEKTKENADKIIVDALFNIHNLKTRVRDAIQQELNK